MKQRDYPALTPEKEAFVVIIPSFKSSHYLIGVVETLIESIKFSEIQGFVCKSVIIVDYQTDPKVISEVKLKLSSAKITHDILHLEKDRGLLHMRLYGAMYALVKYEDVEYFVFVDNDVFVNIDTIYNLLSFTRTRSDAGMCGCQLLNLDGSIQESGIFLDVSMFAHAVKEKSFKQHITHYVTGAIFCLTQKTLKSLYIAKYELLPFWYEDAAIGLNSIKLGYKNVIIPCSVYHVRGTSYSKLDSKRYAKKVFEDFFRARLIMIGLYSPNLILALILYFIDVMIYVISHRAWNSISIIKGVFKGLLVLPKALKSRYTSNYDEVLKKTLFKCLALHFLDLSLKMTKDIFFIKGLQKLITKISYSCEHH